MRVSVFGLGYVGTVTGACLAERGHQVVGVDINADKVRMVNEGISPIVEKRIDEIIKDVASSGRLRATSDPHEAVLESDVALICVGTPSAANGDLETRIVFEVARQIGSALVKKNDYFVVAVRSTVLPGTVEDGIVPILEQESAKSARSDFGVCMNPEFLREGSAVDDFYNPPKTVIGELDPRSGEVVAALHGGLDAPLIRTDVKVAELVKYADNAFHAVKIAFANEIGSIAKSLGVDGSEVMQIFKKDTKLNISQKYLSPGFAFGGSCLGKDLRALQYRSKQLDLETPLISSIIPSNNSHLDRCINLIKSKESKRIGFLGLSFKGGTDDLRESPSVEVVEHLLGKGYRVSIFDGYINVSRLTGRNRQVLFEDFPHLVALLKESIEEVIQNSEVIVIGNNSVDYKKAIASAPSHTVLIDLVGLVEDQTVEAGEYEGICW